MAEPGHPPAACFTAVGTYAWVMPASSDSAILLGEWMPELGGLRVEAAGPRGAVGISAGRYAKSYKHVDPNEDAALVASGPAGHLFVVADGHNGFDAAKAAVLGVHQACAELLSAAVGEPGEILRQVSRVARESVRQALETVDPDRLRSRTALSAAVVSGRKLAAVTFGDTSVALFPAGRFGKPARVTDASAFLGGHRRSIDIRSERVRPGDWVVVASDGVTDFLGDNWLNHVERLLPDAPAPEEAARRIVAAACDAGAGDHVAVAVGQVG